ncbi:MAG TPA: hypothetical protein DCX06_14265 [Opitutae bacterium]|nr:hypothetical protein [Opitutae bacterium]
MANRYTNTKNIRTERFGSSKGEKLLIASFLLLALSIVVIASFNVIAFVQDSKESELTSNYSQKNIEELCNPTVFVEKYLQQNCNLELMETTQTIRISGRIIKGDSIQKFTLAKKKPDLLRLKIIQNPLEITYGVSGETVWRRTQLPNQESHTLFIEGEDAQRWIQQSRFYDLIISTYQGLGRIESIAPTDYEAKTYLKVKVMTAEGNSVEILVDPLTMYPFSETKRLGKSTQTSYFSDYRLIGGLPFSFKLKTYVDGTLDRETVLTEASINIGILSDYFNAPANLSAN